jgi:hypothetical protein
MGNMTSMSGPTQRDGAAMTVIFGKMLCYTKSPSSNALRN